MISKKLNLILILILGFNFIAFAQDEFTVIKNDDSQIKIDINQLKVIRIFNPTGVENNEKSSLLIFPNPTTDKLVINLPNEKFNVVDIKIKISDINSKIVKELTSLNNFNFISTHQIEFSLNNLGIKTKGIYFVELEINNNKLINKIILE